MWCDKTTTLIQCEEENERETLARERGKEGFAMEKGSVRGRRRSCSSTTTVLLKFLTLVPSTTECNNVAPSWNSGRKELGLSWRRKKPCLCSTRNSDWSCLEKRTLVVSICGLWMMFLDTFWYQVWTRKLQEHRKVGKIMLLLFDLSCALTIMFFVMFLFKINCN